MTAVEMARAAGCRVILTSSSDEKMERVRKGMKKEGRDPKVEVVNYRTCERWDEEEVVRLNGGRGVDVAIENGGIARSRRRWGQRQRMG